MPKKKSVKIPTDRLEITKPPSGDGQQTQQPKKGPWKTLDAGRKPPKPIALSLRPPANKQQTLKPKKPKGTPNADGEKKLKPKKVKGTTYADWQQMLKLKKEAGLLAGVEQKILMPKTDSLGPAGSGQPTSKPKKGKARPIGDGQQVPKPKKGKKGRKQSKQKKASASAVKCPICFQNVENKNDATLPDCLHKYCVFCIVRWAEEKVEPTCPQCKIKFDSVMTRRRLDGTIRDVMVPESICLMKRASWYLRSKKRGYKFQTFCAEEGDDDWEDDYFDGNEIDDAEDFYFSREAGAARIVFSNRTFGKNGYTQCGRIYAQPAQRNQQSKAKNYVPKEPSVRPSGRIETNAKGKKTLKREQRKREEAFSD